MGETCHTYEEEKCIHYFSEDTWRKRSDGTDGVDGIHVCQGSAKMSGSYEHGDESLGSIKWGEFWINEELLAPQGLCPV